jgi:hypothetical protein
MLIDKELPLMYISATDRTLYIQVCAVGTQKLRLRLLDF